MFGLVLCFFCFVGSCFAYDIKPFAQRGSVKTGKSLNLAFCSLNYKDAAGFVKDRKILIQRLKITKPFDELNNLEFWYINLSPKEQNKVFNSVSDFPPLQVRNDFLADISNKIKGAYKLIIIDAQGFVPCAELSEAWKTSLVILGRKAADNDNNFAKCFLHELGHAFGLRDECVNCQQRSSGGYPNCASNKEEAVKWWGDLAGKDERVSYIYGCCGNKDYIRPTIASLMNDFHKANDFGLVNERYLRKELGG